MRGTILLLQLIFIYYVLPSIGIRLDRLQQRSLPSRLRRTVEIFRGGLIRFQRQYEAAKVLEFTPGATIHIVLPQVTKIVLAMSSMKITSLVKDTPVYALGISDLSLGEPYRSQPRCEPRSDVSSRGNLPIVIGIVTLVAKRIERNSVIINRRTSRMLELRNIKRFGDKQTLSDFVNDHEGKILAIVGPSEAGNDLASM